MEPHTLFAPITSVDTSYPVSVSNSKGTVLVESHRIAYFTTNNSAAFRITNDAILGPTVSLSDFVTPLDQQVEIESDTYSEHEAQISKKCANPSCHRLIYSGSFCSKACAGEFHRHGKHKRQAWK